MVIDDHGCPSHDDYEQYGDDQTWPTATPCAGGGMRQSCGDDDYCGGRL